MVVRAILHAVTARVLDHLIVPAILAAVAAATALLLAAGVPTILVSGAVVFGVAAVAAVLERARPERPDYVALDQPLATEVAHYLFNYNLGYALALGACALVAAGLDALAVPAA